MEKIKASEILAMNESLTIKELREYSYYGIGGKFGERFVYCHEPRFDPGLSDWIYGGKQINLGRENINNGMPPTTGNRDSLREIDFTDYESESQT